MLEKLLGSRSFNIRQWAIWFIVRSFFFRGARPSFNGSTCCPRLFRMLGFDRSCISFLFLVRWSPYSSWCSDTCKYRYLSLIGRITRYPCDVTWSNLITCLAFWKYSIATLFSNAVFFDEPITQAKIISLLTNVPSNVVQTHFLYYAGPTIGAWLWTHPSTPSFRLSFTHFLTTIYIWLNIWYPIVLHLSRCQCGHTIDDLGIHLLRYSCENECITSHDMLQNIL
jgi:hypothetical protein